MVAEALRNAGAIIHVHSDHFAPDAPDEEWLIRVGQLGWVVLTKDKMIQKRALERNALITARVAAFVLVSGNMSGPEMAEVFVRALGSITRFVAKHRPPYIVKVYRNGKLEPLDLPSEA